MMRKLRIVKHRRHYWLDIFQRYVTNWRSLYQNSSFNHYFLTFFFLTTVLNMYEVIRLESNQKLLLLLFIRKYRANHYIKIVNFCTSPNIMKDIEEDHLVDILQEFKIVLNNYSAVGYSFVEASFLYFDKGSLSFFLEELDFVKNKEKNMANLMKAETADIITITKRLN